MHNDSDLDDDAKRWKHSSSGTLDLIQLIARCIVRVYQRVSIRIFSQDVLWRLLCFEGVNVLNIEIEVERPFLEEPFLVDS